MDVLVWLIADDWSDVWFCFFFQAEDGIRYLVRSRGLGDVYKRQVRGVRRRLHVGLAGRALLSAASFIILAKRR